MIFKKIFKVSPDLLDGFAYAVKQAHPCTVEVLPSIYDEPGIATVRISSDMAFGSYFPGGV